MKQAEPWWTDEDLDRKAQLLRRQHIALRRSSPYFMETEIKDYTETNEDGKWLNDAEIAKYTSPSPHLPYSLTDFTTT